MAPDTQTAENKQIMNKNTTKSETSGRLGRLAPVVALTAFFAGCAHVPNPTPQDPWESYNRSMFQFNEAFDKALFKPIASGYKQLTPEPARNCIHNIFANMADLWASVNSFLQGRGHDGVNMLGRVLFNSTMGLGGCIDVASMNGSQRISNDFGVTLGVWGFKPGPYVVLPFIGSSNVRDAAGIGTMFAAGASSYTPIMAIDNVPLRNTILGVAAVDLRASLLDADDLVDRIALDRYSFIRDAFIQRRQSLVQGNRVDPDAPYGTLPDYSDDELPDYSDDEEAPAAPASGTAPATP